LHGDWGINIFPGVREPEASAKTRRKRAEKIKNEDKRRGRSTGASSKVQNPREGAPHMGASSHAIQSTCFEVEEARETRFS